MIRSFMKKFRLQQISSKYKWPPKLNYSSYPFSQNSFPKRKPEICLREINWQTINLPSFQKNFYKEHPNVTNRTPEEFKKLQAEKEITICSKAPKAISTFEESGLPEYIQQGIKSLGFDQPTPIQCQAWPVAVSGRDMIGIAETGSGKTLAFLIPAIIHINAQPSLKRGEGPIALVLAPTRELAVQIQNQIPTFADSSKINYAAIYGGASKFSQMNKLQSGVDIVVATPGRLLDFLESRTTNLMRTTYLVLDEADRMLDMGFEKQIRQIMGQIRPDRQTLLFSATWPKEIKSLAHEYLVDPVHVNIGSLGLSACKNVKQEFDVVDEHSKLLKLLFYLKQLSKTDKVLIFVATKVMTNVLCEDLRTNGFRAGSISGDKRQSERDSILAMFRSGHINILIGTDVASRGIDIKDIMVVVNYDFPNTIEDYVHRIGRTGRAFATGKSYTLLTRSNAAKVGELIEMMKNDKHEIPAQVIKLHQTYGGYRGKNDYNRYRRR